MIRDADAVIFLEHMQSRTGFFHINMLKAITPSGEIIYNQTGYIYGHRAATGMLTFVVNPHRPGWAWDLMLRRKDYTSIYLVVQDHEGAFTSIQMTGDAE